MSGAKRDKEYEIKKAYAFCKQDIFYFLVRACSLEPVFVYDMVIAKRWQDEFGYQIDLSNRSVSIEKSLNPLNIASLYKSPKKEIKTFFTFSFKDPFTNDQSYIISYYQDKFIYSYHLINKNMQQISTLSLGIKYVNFIYNSLMNSESSFICKNLNIELFKAGKVDVYFVNKPSKASHYSKIKESFINSDPFKSAFPVIYWDFKRK